MGCCQTSSPQVAHSPSKLVSEETLKNFDIRSRYSNRPIEQDYTLDGTTVLGSGLSGAVIKAINRATGEECAVKILQKTGLSKNKLENLQDEVNIYLRLDHPHIARLLHVYEDDRKVCLVMEICSGKELFDRLSSKKRFSEREAQHAAYQMLLAVAYLHKHRIMHCDLKLENFLYESSAPNAALKLIDFGFSKAWRCGLAMTRCQGTPSYTAPEVFAGNYTEKCDLWSLGVIVFIILSGRPPFSMIDVQGAKQNIMKGEYKFDEDRWRHVSEDGHDFVRKLLVVDPALRMSADGCLNHPWLAHLDVERRSEASAMQSVTSSVDLVGCFREYSASSQMKRAAFTMMAHHLHSPALEDVKNMFLWLDTDRSGTITKDNFRNAINGHHDRLDETELWQLFDTIDVAGDGEIHYSEFIAAVLQSRVQIDDKLVREAFELFDVSRTGFITRGDLEHVLGQNGFGKVNFNTLIMQCNASAKQGISYAQFDEMLRSNGFRQTSTDNAASTSIRSRLRSSLFGKSRSNISSRSGSKCSLSPEGAEFDGVGTLSL